MKKGSYNASFPTEIVHEGQVDVLVPKLKAFVKMPSEYAPSKAPVFYNPIMEFNRDVSVLALQSHQRAIDHPVSVCEPLTGCGIRGIRYAAEIKGIQKVLIADLTERAYKLAKYNIQVNKLEELVEARNEEACLLLSQYSAPHKRFDVIDLDPFGSPIPYVDSAIRALRNDGLLAVTATDMAPLCGVHPKACIRRYGGKPLRAEYCHELAVRLLAGCIAAIAAKRDIGIRIVFSHSADHYIRVYATIKYGAKKADESIQNLGYVLHCFKCYHRETVKNLFLAEFSAKCSECKSKLNYAGPLWVGKIFDRAFCELMEGEAKQRAFKLQERIRKLLFLIRNEVEAPSTYYVVDALCDSLNLPVPPIKTVAEKIKGKGFRVSFTHFNPRGIRSNAPAKEIQTILRDLMNAKR